jgi:hypothetical protein
MNSGPSTPATTYSPKIMTGTAPTTRRIVVRPVRIECGVGGGVTGFGARPIVVMT